MAMQYDVKSFHATASTLAYGDRTRLKCVVISPVTSTTFNSCVVELGEYYGANYIERCYRHGGWRSLA